MFRQGKQAVKKKTGTAKCGNHLCRRSWFWGSWMLWEQDDRHPESGQAVCRRIEIYQRIFYLCGLYACTLQHSDRALSVPE